MPKNFIPKVPFERRAIVAIACYFLVAQAFLAGLAGGFAAGGMQARAGSATAFICHGAGTAPDAPPSQENPKFLCGLCALAGSGMALPPAPADFASIARTFTRFVAPADVAAGPSTFEARAGRARAPPIFV
jgi:hypothetical protein